jgi:hypothetical protein
MRHLLLVAASTCAALLVGCPVSGDRSCEELANCPDDGTDASTADGGRDTSSPDGSPDGAPQPDATADGDAGPPPCNTALDPKSAPCVIDEALGVFVAPTGSDATGNGSKAKPYATITKAVAAPRPGMLRAFVCAGTYKEPAVVTAAADGMAIYGGLDCATWAYDAANKVLVAPTAHGPALTVTGVATGLTIEDVEFDAQAGTAAGESSIAGVVSGATGVPLRGVWWGGGAGVAGAAGTVPSSVLPTAKDGKDADKLPGSGGGSGVPCLCPFGVDSVSGQGGSGGTLPSKGATGTPGTVDNSGAGGASCANGGDGVPASAVAPESPGASKLATISGGTWLPMAGTRGTAGGTGQGGGGGGGVAGDGNGGGSGSCGGCGGEGGGFGTGGGTSAALLVVDAPSLLLGDSALASASAGAGGSGAIGQLGAAGGVTKGVNAQGSGCSGGRGGKGGQGGSGGGGAGGISVGIVYKGPAPSSDDSTKGAISTGAPGAGGVGGKPGVNDGISGVKQDLLAF